MAARRKKDASWEDIGQAIGRKVEKESKNPAWKEKPWYHQHHHGGGGAFYGLGFLGALVYYVTTATSLGGAIIGILKAIVWPAFVVFELMKFLGM